MLHGRFVRNNGDYTHDTIREHTIAPKNVRDMTLCELSFSSCFTLRLTRRESPRRYQVITLTDAGRGHLNEILSLISLDEHLRARLTGRNLVLWIQVDRARLWKYFTPTRRIRLYGKNTRVPAISSNSLSHSLLSAVDLVL